MNVSDICSFAFLFRQDDRVFRIYLKECWPLFLYCSEIYYFQCLLLVAWIKEYPSSLSTCIPMQRNKNIFSFWVLLVQGTSTVTSIFPSPAPPVKFTRLKFGDTVQRRSGTDDCLHVQYLKLVALRDVNGLFYVLYSYIITVM